MQLTCSLVTLLYKTLVRQNETSEEEGRCVTVEFWDLGRDKLEMEKRSREGERERGLCCRMTKSKASMITFQFQADFSNPLGGVL